MTIRFYKPYTPSTRTRISLDFSQLDLAKNYPEKTLLEKHHRAKGRNNRGVITIRHRGGGHKRRYRHIDFHRQKKEVVGVVKQLEYDPNRTAHIALLHYSDGEKRYILAPRGLSKEDQVISSSNAKIQIGNALPLSAIPLGTLVHNIESIPLAGGKFVRSAGTAAQIVAKEGNYVTLRLPSGEVRLFLNTCWATIGQVGNTDAMNIVLGKAGRKRWFGKRPTVRGSVMNPVDHPHGGGEGKSAGGRHPVSRTGVSAKGLKTRDNKRTDKFIIRRRGKK